MIPNHNRLTNYIIKMENIVTNIDNDNVAEEYNAELKSASEADTLPMDAKVAGPTEKSKSTQVRFF